MVCVKLGNVKDPVAELCGFTDKLSTTQEPTTTSLIHPPLSSYQALLIYPLDSHPSVNLTNPLDPY